jgi:hypothetical protein
MFALLASAQSVGRRASGGPQTTIAMLTTWTAFFAVNYTSGLRGQNPRKIPGIAVRAAILGLNKADMRPALVVVLGIFCQDCPREGPCRPFDIWLSYHPGSGYIPRVIDWLVEAFTPTKIPLVQGRVRPPR